MRVRSVAAAAAVSTLFCAFGALPAVAGLPGACIPFEHKLKQDVTVVGPGFQCSLEAKVHVDPKDECESQLCLTSTLGNALPEVGSLLKVEVVSLCGDAIPDGVFDAVVETPNVLDGVIEGNVSACIGGAQVSQVLPQEGKIKLNCDDGNAKTKGDFEYQCTPSVVP